MGTVRDSRSSTSTAATRRCRTGCTGDCQPGFINDIAFAGGSVYTIEDGEGRSLVRRDFSNRRDVHYADRGGLGRCRAHGRNRGIRRNRNRDRLIRWRGIRRERPDPGGNTFTLAAVEGFASGATLGSGAGELPCNPITVPDISPQGLPQPVEDKRAEIFRMAAACDMEGLAEIARADGTAFSFGGETDPLRSWIRSARNGFDVMAWIVRLFNSVPAMDDVGTYAWPAVHATNSDEDWQELSGILTAAEFESYSAYRDSGWLGLRIGIAEDGTWRFVVAGD